MENYIYVIAVLIVLIAAVFIVQAIKEARVEIPEPANGQPVIDNQNREWVFLRPLKDGTFLFRNPQGKINSIALNRCDYYGFTRQFNFKAVQKGPDNE